MQTEDATRRVLLVDDDAAFLRSIRRLIEGDGWAVTAVDGPSAGLNALAQGEYAVVVSDYEMNGIDGVQFLRLVRHNAPHVMRLLLTGNSDFKVAVDAVNEGNVFRFVTKASGGDNLLSAVRDAGQAFKAVRDQRTHEVESLARELRVLQGHFETALSGLWMAYQPIVSISRGRTIAYEALLHSASSELSDPSKVLDAAERLNAITVLGRAVRRRVAEDLGRIADADVFINLHVRELMDEALYDPNAPLTRHASRVVLEITERVALGEVTDVRDRIARLRTLGFRIAVDDLGAGYAGLGSLVDLEPEVVKLDMGLTRGIDDHPTKQKLVRGFVALGRELGWLLVAEGVESEVERHCLLELGCDVFQGYLFGKPARLAD